jgi:hypothetical protein
MRKSVNPFVWPLRYGLKTKGFEGASGGCWSRDSVPIISVFELIYALFVRYFCLNSAGFSAGFTGGLGLALGLTCGTTSSDFLEFQGPIKMTHVFFRGSRLPVTIGFAENAAPPRNRATLPGPFLSPFVLLHALARGLVLFAIMTLLRIVPPRSQFCRARSLFFLSTADALLHSAGRLSAASVAWRSPTLGVGGGC